MSKRERHTAPYLLSHFLCSNDQFKFEELNATYQSILRYMYDVMEMTFNKNGQTVCSISNAHIAKFSGTARATVTRALSYFIKHNLIIIVKKISRRPTHYTVGNTIAGRLTTSLDEPLLGSPRAYPKAHHEPHIRDNKKAAPPWEGDGSQKQELTYQERLARLERIGKH